MWPTFAYRFLFFSYLLGISSFSFLPVFLIFVFFVESYHQLTVLSPLDYDFCVLVMILLCYGEFKIVVAVTASI